MEGSLDAVAACLPTFRDVYLEQFRDAGFEDVRITDERPYPTSFILEDEGVKEYVADHPAHRQHLTDFAASIFGAHFEAERP